MYQVRFPRTGTRPTDHSASKMRRPSGPVVTRRRDLKYATRRGLHSKGVCVSCAWSFAIPATGGICVDPPPWSPSPAARKASSQSEGGLYPARRDSYGHPLLEVKNPRSGNVLVMLWASQRCMGSALCEHTLRAEGDAPIAAPKGAFPYGRVIPYSHVTTLG